MQDYLIRDATMADIKQINTAHSKSIREVCSKDYRPEQIKGWSAIIYCEEHFSKSLNEGFYKVVLVNGVIEGFCHAKDHGEGLGEIMGLYLAPNAIGKGLGRKVVIMALEFLKSTGVTKVKLEGTKTALSFYKKMGFRQKGEPKYYSTRGSTFKCFPMVLNLSPR